MKCVVIALYLLIFALSCTNKKEVSYKKTSSIEKFYPIYFITNDSLLHTMANRKYVPTGIYFPAKSAEAGTLMPQENSERTYAIDTIPAVSVKNVFGARLVNKPIEHSFVTELCLQFDKKGKEDLVKATSDPSYPFIALVVADRLLYVAEIKSEISGGELCISLEGYSEKEKSAMLDAVKQKR